MSRIRIVTLLLVLVAGLVFAGTAAAQEDPGYIDQYNEPLPTGGGNQHTGGNGGGGSGGDGGGQLPASTQANLQSSVSAPVATALEEVATSEGLGAPQSPIGKADGSQPGTGTEQPPAPDSLAGSPLTDAVAAASDGGNSHLLAVLIALAAITVGGAAVAFRKRQTSA